MPQMRNTLLAACVTTLVCLASASGGSVQQPAEDGLSEILARLRAHKGFDDAQVRALRKQAFDLAMRRTLPPEVPREARDFFIRGQLAGNNKPEGGGNRNHWDAKAEFEKALRIAPWYPDALLGLARAEDNLSDGMAEFLEAAIANYEMYLKTAPRNDQLRQQAVDRVEVLRDLLVKHNWEADHSITWILENGCREFERVDVRFFDRTNKRQWPADPNRAYSVPKPREDRQVIRNVVSTGPCEPGAEICFRAVTTQQGRTLAWGRVPERNTCAACGTRGSVAVPFTCSGEVQLEVTPPEKF